MSEKGELDLTGAKQNTGMWLVKVPKYLSQQWNKASGRGEVGKLRIAKNQGRTEVSFTLNEELASINDIGGKPASVSAPREHPFLLQSVGGQTLTVFTESSVDKLSLEGIVVQRAECRPAASENYMKLKRLQIEESSKPVRLSQQLDKAVTTNYKPVANHQYNVSISYLRSMCYLHHWLCQYYTHTAVPDQLMYIQTIMSFFLKILFE
uniref:General transcription factor IIF subunit 2 n=1 Tax=Strix occidentalis caurina TaxID=311401 RepID=A0A8D0FXE4_STROC